MLSLSCECTLLDENQIIYYERKWRGSNFLLVIIITRLATIQAQFFQNKIIIKLYITNIY